MLREILEEMNKSLIEQGFEQVANRKEMRQDALRSGMSVYYAQAFLEWLAVCPEARDFLAAKGIPFEGRGQAAPLPSCSAEQDGNRLRDGEFFAMAFGRVSLVKLVEVVGPVIKVVEARPPAERLAAPLRTDITREQVPPQWQSRLDQVLGNAGGKYSNAFWESDLHGQSGDGSDGDGTEGSDPALEETESTES